MSTEIEGLREFITDLGRIGSAAVKGTGDVVERSALDLKNQYAQDAEGSAHFKGMSPSISYESDYAAGQIGYVVGPDKGRRGGALGNISYFGGANGGGGTLDLDGPLKKEEGRLMFALDQFLGGVIG